MRTKEEVFDECIKRVLSSRGLEDDGSVVSFKGIEVEIVLLAMEEYKDDTFEFACNLETAFSVMTERVIWE